MKKTYTIEFFRQMGKKGGQITLKRYGLTHFKKMRAKQKLSTTPLQSKTLSDTLSK